MWCGLNPEFWSHGMFLECWQLLPTTMPSNGVWRFVVHAGRNCISSLVFALVANILHSPLRVTTSRGADAWDSD